MGFLPRILKQSEEQRQAEANRDLIRREAKVGGYLFGHIPEGHQREFFCLDETTWVWHEGWIDTKGQQQSVTTRYEVRPDGVLKNQNNHGYQALGYQEAVNLYKAVLLYQKKVQPLYQPAV
jgi:hypothetical protein